MVSPLSLLLHRLLLVADVITFLHVVPASSFLVSNILYYTASPAKIKLCQSPLNHVDEECLIPETNPNYNPGSKTLSGVRYEHVLKGIDELYPPKELSSRNAKSRSDGYWKYVERGEKPPLEFTYGEFDIVFFGELLDKAWEYHIMRTSSGVDVSTATKTTKPWENKTFIDIGSGTGRLVIAAAALHPNWRVCKGLEILKGIHNVSVNIADSCVVTFDEKDSLDVKHGNVKSILQIPRSVDTDFLVLAPVQMILGSFTNPYQYLADIDCAFVFSSCMKPDLLKQLSIAIGRQCRPGTIVITTEFPLFLTGHIDPLQNDCTMPYGDYEIELLDKIDGWCWLMGGESTAYIHRVKRSLSESYGGPRERRMCLEEEAFQLVQLLERGELTDTKAFMRNVRNNMIFNEVLPEFLPELDEET